MAYDLGRASGVITINVDAALASYAAVREAHAETMTQMGQVQKTAKTVGLGLLGIGAAALFGFGEAVKQAASFQKELSYFGAVTGATKEEIDAVGKSVLKIDATTGVGIAQVTDAFVQLGKSGVSAEDIISGVGQATVDLARAAGISAVDSADIITQTLHAFDLGAKDAEHVADVIAGAANASTIDVTELAAGLKYAGQTAHAMHISFSDLADTIAYLGNVGIRGTTAGTSLRMMLVRLTGTSGPAIAEMQKLGLVTEDGGNKFFTATGRAKDMASIAQVLQNAFNGVYSTGKKLTDEEKVRAAEIIFGNRAMSAAIALAKGGKVAIEAMNLEVSKVTAYQVMEARMDNVSGAIQRFKVALQIAAVEAGNPFQKPIQTLIQFLTMLVTAFNNLPQPIKTALASLLLIVGVLATLGGAFVLAIGFLAKLRMAFAQAGQLGAFLRGLGEADIELKLVGDQAEATAAKVVAANEAMNASSVGPARGANGQFVSKAASGAEEGEAVAGEAEVAGGAVEEGLGGATVAAEGLGAALGPVGIALGVIATVGAAIWYITSKGARQAREDVQAYTSTLADSTNNISTIRGKLVALNEAQQAVTKGFLVNVSHGGASFGDFEAYGAKLSEYNKEIQTQQDKLNSTTSTVSTLSKAYGINANQVQALAAANNIDLTKGLGASGEAFATALEAARASHHPMQQAVSDVVAFGSAAASSADDVNALTSAFASLTGDVIDADDAHNQFLDGIDALDAALKKSGGSMRSNNALARASREAFNGAAKQAGSWAEAEAKLPGGAGKAIRALTEEIKVLKAHSDGSKYAEKIVRDLNKTLITIKDAAKQGSDGLNKSKNDVDKSLEQMAATARKKLDPKNIGAYDKGHKTGEDWGHGDAKGIADTAGEIASAARGVVDGATTAAEEEQDSNSPAKKVIPVGHDWGGGFALGIMQSVKVIVAAARHAAREATKAAAKEVQKGIAASVAPEVTDPTLLAGSLKQDYLSAVSKTAKSTQLDKVTKSATKSLDKLKDIDRQRSQELQKQAKAANSVQGAIEKLNKKPINATTVDAAKQYAKHLEEVASKAHSAEEQLSSGNAKKAAEKNAEALSAEAKAATNAADKIDHKYTLLEKHAEAAQQKAKKASDAANAMAKNAQEKAQAAAQALVSAVQSEVDDLTSEISDMQSTFASDIRGSDNIQSIWEELLGEGTATTSNLQGRLDEVQASVERFADDLKKLAGMGASSDLLEQIAGMGPDEGDMLAQQLISAGTGSVSQLNSTLSTIDSYVQSTADDLTKNFYGAGVDALSQFIKGLESQFPELKKALDAVLAELQGALDPTAVKTNTVATATKALTGTGIVASTAAPTKVGAGAFGAAGALVASGGSTKITTINMGPTYNPAPEPSSVTVARRLRTLAAIGPW